MSDSTVLVLFFLLVCILAALLFMYKKLNKETNGQYTIRRIVYNEGGLRDRARGIAIAIGTHLGIQSQPNDDHEEDEMGNNEDEEGQVEGSSSQGSDTEGEDEQEEVERHCMDHAKGNGSNKSSSLEESEDQEKQTVVKDENEEQKEEKQSKVEEEQSKVEASGGTGLLIDLKQFSGSAIWSEEGGGEGRGGDVTAL